MNVDEAIAELAEANILGARQTEAFVLREIEAVPRQAVADEMGISVNTVDNTVRAAKQKIEDARATVEAVETIRHADLPTTCVECGATLGGRYSQRADGEAICLDCAGVGG